MSKKLTKTFLISFFCSITLIYIIFTTHPQLTTMLPIDNRAASKAIDVLDACDNVVFVVSIIGIITGAGAIGVGILQTAKMLGRKYGKKYAVAW
ncbi:MAG: uberolysin/carnocyclin family circular bacteriocin [Lactobacillales bacterium]|jgi:circularin A/uberolysin family circular bacteriocin|nr:uberolysin/carnocyclin family circular bacteriocin [Lactobacillales bacterium]